MNRIEHLLSLAHLGILADESYLLGFISSISSLQTEADARELIQANAGKNAPFLMHISEEGNYSYGPADDQQHIPHGTVLVLQLRGPVMPEGYVGIPGLSELSDMLRSAKNDDRIAGVVMLMETGGGSIYRLDEFTDLIQEVKKEKPVNMLADGLCASAGVHIGVSGNNFFATHKSARIGSIGTMMAHMDMISFLEAKGCKYHMVVAPTSPDKNKEFIEMRAGIYSRLEENLSIDHDAFKSHIQANRKEVPQEAMTGKMYNATQAQSLNIIDGMATLEQVVSHTLQIASSKLNPQTT